MAGQEYSAPSLVSPTTLPSGAEVIPLPTARRSRAERGTFTKSIVQKMRCLPDKVRDFFWDAGCRGLASGHCDRDDGPGYINIGTSTGEPDASSRGTDRRLLAVAEVSIALP